MIPRQDACNTVSPYNPFARYALHIKIDVLRPFSLTGQKASLDIH